METNSELEQLRAARDRAVDDLDAFVYRISHDFAAPIRAIQSSSMIIKEDYAEHLPPECVAELDSQAKAAKKLGDMVSALLTLSRLGRNGIVRTSIDLGAIASDLVKKPTLRGLRLELQGDLAVEADLEIVTGLLEALLLNAAHATAARGSVVLARLAEGFVLDDNGIGVGNWTTRDLTQPFVSGFEPPRLGMGLAFVRKAVALHEGTLDLEPSPLGGARVRFSLGRA